MRNNKVGPFFIPYTISISKLIKDLNVGAETIKLLEENVGVNLVGLVRQSLSRDTKSTSTKEKNR